MAYNVFALDLRKKACTECGNAAFGMFGLMEKYGRKAGNRR